MADSITTTTTTSYGSRIKSALAGLVAGPVIVFIACGFLWRNEADNAHMISAIAEWKSTVQEANIASVDAALQGKLIHLSGVASTKDMLSDPDFSLSIPAIKLERKIETYQWKEDSKEETKDNYGGSQTTTTTYTYTKDWDQEMIKSSDFHEQAWHENPTAAKYTSLSLAANDVSAGVYKLSSPMIERIPADTTLSLTEYSPQLHSWEILQGNTIYVGKDPQNSQVWDTRVSYTIASNNLTLSLLGKQSGSNSIESYIAKSGSDISRVEVGTKSALEMFQAAEKENSLMTWIVRALGILFVYIWFSLFFQILPILAKIIPPLSWLIGAWVGLVALILTLIVWGGVIMVAWFLYRPLLSLVLLAVLMILIGWVYSLMHKKNAQAVTPSIPPAV